MAKKAYVGVNGTARKMKKLYAGVGGTARKVKKGYVGVGGIARPCWTGGELTYFGSSEDGAIAALNEKNGPHSSINPYIRRHQAVSFMERAVFFMADADASLPYDAYDTQLNKLSGVSLLFPRTETACCTLKNHIFVCGGRSTNYGPYRADSVVEAIDDNYVNKQCSWLKNSRKSAAAAANDSYALVVGGIVSTYDAANGDVDSYDVDLVHTFVGILGAQFGRSPFTVGKYACFTCPSAACTAYDQNLVRTSFSCSSYINSTTASTKKRALIYGGKYFDSDDGWRTDAFYPHVVDENLVSTAISGRFAFTDSNGLSGTSIEELILIGMRGGPIEIYDESLVAKVLDTSSGKAGQEGIAVTVGDYVLFGGGYEMGFHDGFGYTSWEYPYIDVYTI